MYNYKRSNNTMDVIMAIIRNMDDEDFNKLNDLDTILLFSGECNRKSTLAKAQRICKKYGITYGDFVAWAEED